MYQMYVITNVPFGRSINTFFFLHSLTKRINLNQSLLERLREHGVNMRLVHTTQTSAVS